MKLMQTETCGHRYIFQYFSEKRKTKPVTRLDNFDKSIFCHAVNNVYITEKCKISIFHHNEVMKGAVHSSQHMNIHYNTDYNTNVWH